MFQLQDDTDFCATLLTGSRGALLLDSMSGLGDVRETMEEITSLPVTPANSHVYFGRTGGNHRLNSACLSPQDIPHNVFGVSYEQRAYLADCLAQHARGGLSREKREAIHQSVFTAYPPWEKVRILPRGGLSAQPVTLIGYTPGSMGLLMPERRLLLAGRQAASGRIEPRHRFGLTEACKKKGTSFPYKPCETDTVLI